jgi:hypothetical protein
MQSQKTLLIQLVYEMQYFLIFLPFIIISLILWRVHKKLNLILNDENLVRQPLFWSAIIAPTVLFFYFGYFSWSDHSPQLDSNGLINFYNISKIPLLLLASSVPLAAMISNLHRTIQTESQINETKKKNSNDLYYSHFKFYTESFSKIPTYELELSPLKKEIHLSHHFKLYREIFPNATPLNELATETNNDYFNELLKHWMDINELLKEHNFEYDIYLNNKASYNFVKIPELINKIELNLVKICRKLAISDYHYSKSAIYFYGQSSINPTSNTALHSSFFNHSDMCETIESIEKINSRLIDIINPSIDSQYVRPSNDLIEKQEWLRFKLFTSLDEHPHSFNMPYNQPTFIP